MDFAELLTALMAERHINGCQLARLAFCDRSLVYKYRQGKRKPSVEMAERFDTVLNAGGLLVELARPSRRKVLAGGALLAGSLALAPETVERLAWAERHPPRIDDAAVESLTSVLTTQRHAEDAMGSAVMLKPVAAQLEVVEDLVRQARGPVRPAVINCAMQWAQFSGWLCRNTSDTGGAQVRLGQTLEWATELNDKTMISTVMAEKSEMAAYAGHAGTAVGLAQAAQRDRKAAPGQRAQAAIMEARGHALAGDGAAVDRKLGEAQELTAVVRPQDQRSWLYWMTAPFFQGEAGITCAALAADPRWYNRAVTLLETEDGTAGAWAPAQNLTHLAYAHTQAGEVEQACATAVQASEPVRQAGSVRLARMLGQINAHLAARYPDDVRVKELADALA